MRNRKSLLSCELKELEYSLICAQNDLYIITAQIIQKLYDEGSSFERVRARRKSVPTLPRAPILRLRKPMQNK
ncbi:MAG: hypothetical protein ABS69_04085 [Nitrosomonadales bacterium SCN 54-20]|nr:MAG: hypothetical protein ABS69_04085 [Nitrosomonadales bacterium SCN 54-20]